jgi:hypothetical protein
MLTADARPNSELLLNPIDAVIEVNARDNDMVKFAATHAAF